MLEDDNWVGTIGFFECSGGQTGAFALFDTAVHWLEKYFKITAVKGPVNFADKDKYSGLLTQGFTTPSYGMNYHQPGYRKYFEDYGFTIHPTQLTSFLDLQMKRPDALPPELSPSQPKTT